MPEQIVTTCICINDIEFPNAVVNFDYQPSEPSTFFYPGCDESITVNTVEINGNEFPTWLYPAIKEQVEEDCWQHIAENKNKEKEYETEFYLEAMRERAARMVA